VPEFLVIQPKRLDPAEGRRVWSSVDNHVVYRTPGAANEFRFPPTGSEVQTAECTDAGPGLGVLGERCWVKAVRGRNVGVERTREETAIVMVRRRNEDEYAEDGCRANLHRAIVARRRFLSAYG
jgi:hypothetical protein